jgi:hypothetical protein
MKTVTATKPLLQRLALSALTALLASAVLAAETSAPRVAINFPFQSPETAPTPTFLSWLADLGAPALRQMTYNDVHWIQVEPADGAFNYAKPDQVFSNAYGIHPLPTLYGIIAGPNDVYGLQVPWRACTNPPYAPDCGWRAERDAPETENYVTNTVARYRHVARYWEIANEMNGKTSRPLGLPVPDFAAFMHSNRVWILAADPEAKVVLPGMLGTYGFPFANSTNWLGQLLAAGGAGSFDVANYHDYNSWWTLPRHYDMCRAVLDAHGLTHTPIWVTETGISSRTNTSITPRYSSPDAQAADVWRRFALLYGKGAQLVAWHNHYSANLPGGTGFDQFGLLDHTGKKKKSWHAMKLLIQKLEGFETAQLLATGLINDDNLSGGAGAWAVRFRCADGAHRYVLWSPDNQNHTLTGLTARTYQTLRVVPATLSPDGQTATFLTNTVTPAAGQYTFALEDAPILVEPVPPPPFALRGELDVSGAPVLVWSAEVGEVITVEVAATLLPANWTLVPAGDLEFSIVGTEKRARYVGPLSPPLFFRLRWSAP